MTTPTASNYHDRKTGLVVFGIVEIVIGGLCALGILLILIGRAVGTGTGNVSPEAPSVIPVVIMYAFIGVIFIWLGIGSIQARRWARALWLCSSGVALCAGLLASIWMAMILPRAFEAIANASQPTLKPGVFLLVKTVMIGFLLLVYILIPGALFLFYRSTNVKRTCEVRDPVTRWTDSCPPPVLAMSLMSGFGGIIFLSICGRFHGYPVFGVFVTGVTCYFLFALMIGMLLYLAWGLYRLSIQAWRIALAMTVMGGISNVVTFWSNDLVEMYKKMGLDQRTAAITVQLFSEPVFKWVTALSFLPWLIWLLVVRKYFISQTPPPLLPNSQSTLSF